MSREDLLVELVDGEGVATGTASVLAAHTAPGQLHRAFSVVLVDEVGRLLVQRRAAAKTRFALRWANSCCGHPAPGTPVAEAAAIRVQEELGLAGITLKEVGVYLYRAADQATGRVEYEYDHVLVGRIEESDQPLPAPPEVAEVALVTRDELRDGMAAAPDAYAPWFAGVLALLPD
jgi:isopentenyl-diphosphate Delta-isomerase